MKAIYALPLLLTLASCKYDSLNKIVNANGTDVVMEGNQQNMGCLEKQITKLDHDLYMLKKAQRQEVAEIFKAKIDRIILKEDVVSKTAKGVRSSFSHVVKNCYESGCYYSETATKNLKDETTSTGKNPVMKVSLVGRELILQSEEFKDMTVNKKYYTRSVETYDLVDSLESAVNDPNVWNEPTRTGDSTVCAKPISLESFLAIIQK